MIDYDTLTIWAVILILALGTFVLRFSFLGGIGKRALPEWAMRGLRYTSVAVLPALIAPGTLWPAATGGQTDPARLLAAVATVIAGAALRSTVAAITAGLVTLYLGLWLLG